MKFTYICGNIINNNFVNLPTKKYVKIDAFFKFYFQWSLAVCKLLNSYTQFLNALHPINQSTLSINGNSLLLTPISFFFSITLQKKRYIFRLRLKNRLRFIFVQRPIHFSSFKSLKWNCAVVCASSVQQIF